MSKTVLTVCRNCKTHPQRDVKGLTLADALRGALAEEKAMTVRVADCLSNCSRGCSVALTAPKKWQYVYGDMDPEWDVADLVALAKAYASSADGQIPWRDRPKGVRHKVIARLPAL